MRKKSLKTFIKGEKEGKKFYSRFRICLITFAFGLANVFVLNGSLQFSDEISVNLPEAKSARIIWVYPKLSDEISEIKTSIIACDRGKLIKLEENNPDHK